MIVGHASAREVEVLAGWTKPPYIVADTQSGFELDLVNAILKELGHEMTPIFVPFGRTAALLKSHSADIGLTMNERHDIDPAVFSRVYVVYQNAAITLHRRHIQLDAIGDLSPYSIVAFQTAHVVLGPEFGRLIEQHGAYLEMPQQARQASLLLHGSVDVAIMDRHIFGYLKHQMPKAFQSETDIHPLFPVSAYRAGILDPTLREGFNRVLTEMIKDGRYQALLDKYALTNLFNKLDPVSQQPLASQ